MEKVSKKKGKEEKPDARGKFSASFEWFTGTKPFPGRLIPPASSPSFAGGMNIL